MKRQQHLRHAEPLPRVANPNKKGSEKRRIIARTVDGGREYTLHATKGYRSARA